MNVKRLTALQLYGHLPKTDCGRCGFKTCMSYALKLLEREAKPSDCPLLSDEQWNTLNKLLMPPVQASSFSNLSVGGEEVLYRHEFRFFNPPPFFMDVSDLMPEEEILDRIKLVKDFSVERAGMRLSLDGVSVRSASNKDYRFRKALELVSENFSGPLILCSFKPEVLRDGLELVGSRRPLLYAADSENWSAVLKLARKYDTAFVVYSPTVEGLSSLSKRIISEGFSNLILDPGIDVRDDGLARTVNKFTLLRKAALDGVGELGFPLMASTASVWMRGCGDESKPYLESTIASLLLHRFASLFIVHSIERWSLLPLLILRSNIYGDPRVEPTVEPKLYEIGEPNEFSPVLLSTNFTLTYFSVSDDLRRSGVSCFLLIIDSGGLAATVAVAADKLSVEAISRALEKSRLSERVNHKKLIIPGVMESLKEELERRTGWDVIVGPQDSSQLGVFLGKEWSTL
ncbi:MAG: acetyl-CoA decarbonylase/synthase complex subunit gamma [Candidatus Altiarchaeota archaeon]|nr:acetyl-CoA decarbonylase/synthase complex subunit gamma [Candidatus Altiarchaeota archaeon]